MQQLPYPRPPVTATFFAGFLLTVIVAVTWLLGVEDPVYRKSLVEDEGPVQLLGQTAIFLAFGLACLYAVFDQQRRTAYLQLSYLLMFYALREADYHYMLSEHAKATQFKRFFGHELIPVSSKLFLAAIVILFLVVMYRYLKTQWPVFIAALENRLPWSLLTLAWAGVFSLSQAVDQAPMFHNLTGQVFEEILESAAELLALAAMILFRLQLRRAAVIPARSAG